MMMMMGQHIALGILSGLGPSVLLLLLLIRANARLRKELAHMVEDLRAARERALLADTDPLTGVFNRRHFDRMLALKIKRAHREGRNLSLLLVDIDDFKAINDEHGHVVGDRVLIQVAQRMKEAVRRGDIVCRVGGEEFAVILLEATLAEANGIFRRLQDAAGRRLFAPERGVSLSAGLAEIRRGDDAITLLGRADVALLGAKAGGKNRLVASEAS